MMNEIEHDHSEPDTCEHCERWQGVSLCDYSVINGNSVAVVKYCADCAHDHLAQCEDCKALMFADEGIRIYGTSTLFCESCAAKHPKVILGREMDARLDEARGK